MSSPTEEEALKAAALVYFKKIDYEDDAEHSTYRSVLIGPKKPNPNSPPICKIFRDCVWDWSDKDGAKINPVNPRDASEAAEKILTKIENCTGVAGREKLTSGEAGAALVELLRVACLYNFEGSDAQREAAEEWTNGVCHFLIPGFSKGKKGDGKNGKGDGKNGKDDKNGKGGKDQDLQFKGAMKGKKDGKEIVFKGKDKEFGKNGKKPEPEKGIKNGKNGNDGKSRDLRVWQFHSGKFPTAAKALWDLFSTLGSENKMTLAQLQEFEGKIKTREVFDDVFGSENSYNKKRNMEAQVLKISSAWESCNRTFLQQQEAVASVTKDIKKFVLECAAGGDAVTEKHLYPENPTVRIVNPWMTFVFAVYKDANLVARDKKSRPLFQPDSPETKRVTDWIKLGLHDASGTRDYQSPWQKKLGDMCVVSDRKMLPENMQETIKGFVSPLITEIQKGVAADDENSPRLKYDEDFCTLIEDYLLDNAMAFYDAHASEYGFQELENRQVAPLMFNFSEAILAEAERRLETKELAVKKLPRQHTSGGKDIAKSVAHTIATRINGRPFRYAKEKHKSAKEWNASFFTPSQRKKLDKLETYEDLEKELNNKLDIVEEAATEAELNLMAMDFKQFTTLCELLIPARQDTDDCSKTLKLDIHTTYFFTCFEYLCPSIKRPRKRALLKNRRNQTEDLWNLVAADGNGEREWQIAKASLYTYCEAVVEKCKNATDDQLSRLDLALLCFGGWYFLRRNRHSEGENDDCAQLRAKIKDDEVDKDVEAPALFKEIQLFVDDLTGAEEEEAAGGKRILSAVKRSKTLLAERFRNFLTFLKLDLTEKSAHGECPDKEPESKRHKPDGAKEERYTDIDEELLLEVDELFNGKPLPAAKWSARHYLMAHKVLAKVLELNAGNIKGATRDGITVDDDNGAARTTRTRSPNENILLGLWHQLHQNRGGAAHVTKAMMQMPNFVKCCAKYFRPEGCGATNVIINFGVRTREHIDALNTSPSTICSFGKFDFVEADGDLGIREPKVKKDTPANRKMVVRYVPDDPKSNRLCQKHGLKKNEKMHMRVQNVWHNWFTFDALEVHASLKTKEQEILNRKVENWAEHVRIVMIWFTHRRSVKVLRDLKHADAEEDADLSPRTAEKARLRRLELESTERVIRDYNWPVPVI